MFSLYFVAADNVFLSVIEQLICVGAIIVTTPQDIALLDVTRGIEMFKKVSIPVHVYYHISHDFAINVFVIGVWSSSKHECFSVSTLWSCNTHIWP